MPKWRNWTGIALIETRGASGGRRKERRERAPEGTILASGGGCQDRWRVAEPAPGTPSRSVREETEI